MDKLEEIFRLQKKFDTELEKSRHLSGFTMEEWVQKKVLATVAELMEVIDEVNYKWWKNPKDVDMAHIKEEMIDVLHFFVSTCLTLGMTPDELYQIYVAKNQENQNRQKGLSQKKGYALEELSN